MVETFDLVLFVVLNFCFRFEWQTLHRYNFQMHHRFSIFFQIIDRIILRSHVKRTLPGTHDPPAWFSIVSSNLIDTLCTCWIPLSLVHYGWTLKAHRSFRSFAFERGARASAQHTHLRLPCLSLAVKSIPTSTPQRILQLLLDGKCLVQ